MSVPPVTTSPAQFGELTSMLALEALTSDTVHIAWLAPLVLLLPASSAATSSRSEPLKPC